MKTSLVFVATAVLAAAALAFPPPTEMKDGVSLTLVGLDQGPKPARPDWDRRKIGCKVLPADAMPPIVLALSNGTNKAVSGRLDVWMNEDWTLEPATEQIEVAPGAVREVTRTAKAKPSVMPGLYPIHAKFTTASGLDLHPIAVFQAQTTNRAFRTEPKYREKIFEGCWRLDNGFRMDVKMSVAGETWTIENPKRSDPISNGHFRRTDYPFNNGVSPRLGFSAHPPYKTGVGEVVAEFPIELPRVKPIVFRFFNALSNAGKDRNPGDGVTVAVRVRENRDGAAFREVFRQDVPESGVWLPGEVDLSAYAGKRIVLQLWGNPGAKNNTSCDSHAWGDPIIEVGEVPAKSSAADWKAREIAAAKKAKAALDYGADSAKGCYLLEDERGKYGAGVAYGPEGILDAAIAFTDGRKVVAIRGFEVDLDGERLTWLKSAPAVRYRVWSEKGALKVGWDTSLAQKAKDGSPRFTRLTTGPCSHRVKRVYGGTGCVWENFTTPFKFNASGFSLSTRHAGLDFKNGLSLVLATDFTPDYLEVDGSNKVSRLVAHNDVVFSFVPSNRGAFDAAIRFAAVSGYRPSAGIPAMKNRICIDDWSGGWGDASGYLKEAKALRLAKKYGLDDVLYLQHNWQRWGYDTRLPDVYPPKGKKADFDEMVKAAKDAGYLFGIHDNYVDYYPDADGFSYRLFCYNPDGTPRDAWYNPGPRSLSYRWLPQAFHAKLKSNMALQREGFRPNAIFIDVFTASTQFDVLDHTGRFYPARDCNREWCKAWEEVREGYGVPDAVTVSEAGSDSQIGSIDAGECDHFNPKYQAWTSSFADGERVPWHDAVTHGKMLLFGGGLGFRYSREIPGDNASGDQELHGWGSDDYLSTTVIGGRVPMAPSFGRITCQTYWMLHDVCGALGQQTFENFEFVDDNLHRLHSTFSNGEVFANRDTNSVWKLANGMTLPTYGYYAKAGECEADVSIRSGIRTGCARRPGCVFVDARPRFDDGGEKICSSKAVSAKITGREVEVMTEWEFGEPLPACYLSFTHVVPAVGKSIGFHGSGVRLPQEIRTRGGRCEAVIKVVVPEDAAPGDYEVRYGLYDPKAQRLPIRGVCDNELRVRGGVITVTRDEKGALGIVWNKTVVTPRDRELGLNAAGVMADFGGIRTDGAFRLTTADWRIVPLPGSMPFTAEIDLSKFAAAGRKVKSVKVLDPLRGAVAPRFEQSGDILKLDCDGAAFGYQLEF